MGVVKHVLVRRRGGLQRMTSRLFAPAQTEACNALTRVPVCVGSLEVLRVLHKQWNQLARVPDVIYYKQTNEELKTELQGHGPDDQPL